MEDNDPSPLAPDVPPQSALVGAGAARRATCANCGADITGPYCATCGQLHRNLNRQVWSLAGELLEDLFRLDSRIARTLFALLFRPGFLTTEFFAGRRARYTPPVRLYLVISFVFFFLLPMISSFGETVHVSEESIQVDGQAVEPGDDDVSFSGIELPWLTAEENRALEQRLEQQTLKAQKQYEEDPAVLFSALMDQMSAVMFFMLPIFAVFLKILYLGSGVYYAEHLLLAVHNHCFLFITLLASAVLEAIAPTTVNAVTGTIDDVLMIWIVLYMYLSLRTVFSQGYVLTFFKFLLLGFVYVILTTTGLIAASLIGVMSL